MGAPFVSIRARPCTEMNRGRRVSDLERRAPYVEGDCGSCKVPSPCDGISEQNPGSVECPTLVEELPVLRELKPVQRGIIRRLVTMLDTHQDSVVITNPLVRNSPIVHVTQAWQSMCGYGSEEAVGQNPRLTQGEGSDPNTIKGIGVAIQQQRPCKVRLLNYRGAKREPFWNCLTIHPIFHQKELVLFVARLQDYSYRLNKLISLKPAQFCKSSDEHLQCRIRLSELAQARTLARAYSIDASSFDVDGRSNSGGEDEGELLPSLPQRHVKRLTFGRLQLEPEYLLERLRDECAQLQLPCHFSEMVGNCGELMRLEVHQSSGDEHDKESDLNVIMHVMPEGEEGDYGISFTRLRGDTFKFHALFRALRDRLADVIASADELSPVKVVQPKLPVALAH